MYFCQITGRMSKPGEKLNKIVMRTRPQEYSQKIWEDGELVNIEVGKGWEIVRELNACDEGVRIWNSFTEMQKQQFVPKT